MNIELKKAFLACIDQQDLPTFQRLVDQQPELEKVRLSGRGILHYVARDENDNPDFVKYLLDKGMDVNLDLGNVTPLALAVRRGAIKNTRLLLERGADPNLGRPFISAINSDERSLDLVKLLLEFGADPNIKHNFAGEFITNALSWAIVQGKEEIAEYLRAHGAVLPKGATPENPVGPMPGGPNDEIVEAELVDGPPSLDGVIDYMRNEFGPVHPLAQQEIIPSVMPIDIHVARPRENQSSLILFTTGMSEYPMTVSEEYKDFRFGELFIELPANWPLKKEEMTDLESYWPFFWLRQMARQLHEDNSCMDNVLTVIDNSEENEPIGPNTPMTAMLVMPDRTFTRSDEASVYLFRAVPLYREERDLATNEGIITLLQAFDKHDISKVFNPKRTNVALAGQ